MYTLLTAAETTEEIVEVAQGTVEEVGKLAKYLEAKMPEIIEFGFKVVLTLILFAIGRKIIKWIRKIVRISLEKSSVDKGVEQFIDSLLKFGLYALMIFTIATNFGVDTASVAALLASAGVAIGLALQGSLSNFAGGVLILLLKPFAVGDYIIEDNHKNEGTVTEIQLFYTKLTTLDNKTIIIPNGMLTNNSLTNVSEKKERKLDLKVDISYDSDLKKAKTILRRLIDAEEKILKDEEIQVFVHDLGASSVVLGLRAWVKAEDYWDVRWKLLEDIKLTMDAEGIEIPFQQLTVHVDSEK